MALSYFNSVLRSKNLDYYFICLASVRVLYTSISTPTLSERFLQMETFHNETLYNNFDRWLQEPRLQKGDGAGHYYNDFTPVHSDYADGWYIRKAKGTQHDVREMLIDLKLRGNRLVGEAATETNLHRGLQTGYNLPEHGKLPHLDYKHKKGRFEHLYRKY